ncbi:hypothetical protein HPP92_020569 [Vanilla planifolia]|uniref:Uncharacterized protein n=1 Tax=Vanilla planifolia TaxID=51239 RepID=A0A835UKY0_VANPL|nr:hypothetical protein HPP92_020569 [Vanilla planifolia]
MQSLVSSWKLRENAPPLRRSLLLRHPIPPFSSCAVLLLLLTPKTKTQLLNSELPKLKQSLCIAHHLFYLLVGSLTASTAKAPSIHYSDYNTVAVTAATSSKNF